MEEKQKSAFMPSLMPGIYLGIVLIIYSLLLFLLDVDRESYINYFSYVILAAGLFWSITTFRDKQLGGYIKYGKAFSSGFYTGLFASVLTGFFLYIYVQYIDLGMIDDILVKAEESMLEQNPDMSDEQLDQALYMTESFTSPIMMGVFGFIANVAFSAILSLIIAIFAKRENKQVA